MMPAKRRGNMPHRFRKERLSKGSWLYEYERAVKKRARIRPTSDALWTGGHMGYDLGLSPTAAASRFLRSTRYGVKRVLRRTKHRRSR